MRYMLLHCTQEAVEMTSTEQAMDRTKLAAWLDEMTARGVLQTGSRLQPTADAATVRLRDGELIVSDGPFAETTEQVGGFDLIDCADLDEAIEIASKHPTTLIGSIEIRPLRPE